MTAATRADGRHEHNLWCTFVGNEILGAQYTIYMMRGVVK